MQSKCAAVCAWQWRCAANILLHCSSASDIDGVQVTEYCNEVYKQRESVTSQERYRPALKMTLYKTLNLNVEKVKSEKKSPYDEVEITKS